MVRFIFLSIILFLSIAGSEASASTAQYLGPITTKNSNASARALYKQQCSDVGGIVNGYCMCEERKDLLVMASAVIAVTKDLSKLSQEAFTIINPFTKSCTGKPVDATTALKRLYKIHEATLASAKNETVKEELFLLDELGLFEPDLFAKYMSNANFKATMKAQIKKMKLAQQSLVNKGVSGAVRTITQDKAKLIALGALDEFTGHSIAQGHLITTQVRNLIQNTFHQTTAQTLSGKIKQMGTKFATTTAKSLGKGFVAGLIITAGLESVSYLTGYDLTAFDPFQVFAATPAGDGTISGNITKNVSLALHPEFSTSLEAGFYTNPDVFSRKLVIMAMIAEVRAKDKSMFSFLEE